MPCMLGVKVVGDVIIVVEWQVHRVVVVSEGNANSRAS